MKITSFGLMLGGLILALAAGTSRAAETDVLAGYPAKPIRIIAPTPPGSPPDIVARLIGERLQSSLGQPVIVENRPGAVGTIGMQVVAKAPADGYTFGVLALPFALAPFLVTKMPYDTQKDLAPVAQVVWAANILVVSAASPIRSLDDLLTQAKDRPDRLTYASGGNGTPAHLAVALLELRSGTHMTHVPFRGAAEGVASVLGGQVDVMFAAAGSVLPHIRSGKLRALATSGPARLAAAPELRTVAEQGFRGFGVSDWQGIVAPSGVPPAILDKVALEVRRIVALPEVRERLLTMGMEAVDVGDREAFGALIRSEMSAWSQVIREAGIHVD